MEAKIEQVIRAAKTYVAASRLPKSISLNHFCNSREKRKRHPLWFILDEISMIGTPLWVMVTKVSFCGTRFVFFCDWMLY